MNGPEAATKGKRVVAKTRFPKAEADGADAGSDERVTDDFVIVQRSEFHVALTVPITDVTSTRNSRDRFTVTGFFVHAWHDSARKRTISTQARLQRRVGVPHERITTIHTDDPRVAATLRTALKQIGVR